MAVIAWRWAWRRRRRRGCTDVVVSLTSYAERFSTLHWTLRSLLLQSVMPNALVLWVGHEDRGKIPPAVDALRAEGLEIRETTDIRSYTKIIPALRAFPRAAIVTADDDIYYPRDWLKALLAAWDGDGRTIVAHRAHEMTFLNDGRLAPYEAWKTDIAVVRNPALLFPTGVAGILYPPGSFHEDVTKSEFFMELCPTADDIWLYWMGRLNKVRVRLSGFRFRLVNWPGSQRSALSDGNIGLNENDVQIRNMLGRWPIEFSPAAYPE